MISAIAVRDIAHLTGLTTHQVLKCYAANECVDVDVFRRVSRAAELYGLDLPTRIGADEPQTASPGRVKPLADVWRERS